MWFLRKHAPMPVAYAGFMGDDETPSPVKKASSHSPDSMRADDAGGTSARGRGLPEPQRKFLHGALHVIGAELDNQPDAIADGFGRTPHPQGSRVDHQTACWHVRENLRKRYAAHTDSELDELEAAVKAKEQEVVALRKQVEQMERFLAATNAAAARRVHRLKHPNEDRNKEKASSSVASIIVKTQKRFLSAAGANAWETDDGVPRSTKENVIEEWQSEMLRQAEKAQSMRAHVDEQIKLLQQQTVQRKAQEAALFASHSTALRLRAQTHQMEARVQRLANELKRVYQTLPETIQLKLCTEGAVTRSHHKETELRALAVEHHSEFFKYMDPGKIREEAESAESRIADIEEQTILAHQVIERGKWFAESGVQHAKSATAAMNALHDRYSRFEAAGHPAGQLTIKDSAGNESNDADCILQRATLSVKALEELIEILHQGDALEEFGACETSMNRTTLKKVMKNAERDNDQEAASSEMVPVDTEMSEMSGVLTM